MKATGERSYLIVARGFQVQKSCNCFCRLTDLRVRKCPGTMLHPHSVCQNEIDIVDSDIAPVRCPVNTSHPSELSYQWLRDDIEIPDATASTAVIKRSNTTHYRETITCRASTTITSESHDHRSRNHQSMIKVLTVKVHMRTDYVIIDNVLLL